MTASSPSVTGYRYHYRYNGVGRTAAWLSSERYAVVDISAGPASFGRLDSAAGFVNYKTIPNLRFHLLSMAKHSENFPDNTKAEQTKLLSNSFRGHLSSVLVSAVHQLFAPDVWLEKIDTAEKILVPVIVLRDHLDFDPCEEGHDHSVATLAIEEEINKNVHSTQKAVVVCVTHSLHEHPHPMMSVARATSGRSAKGNLWTFLDGEA